MNALSGDFSSLAKRAVASLETAGFCVLPLALSPGFCARVREEIHAFQSSGKFIPAQIGKGVNHQKNAEIRRDGTCWFIPENPTSVQSELTDLLENFRNFFNTELFLGLWELEGHYAVYAPGAFYRKHLDRFQNDSRRVLSVVAFFNESWRQEDGGCLSLELPEGISDVLPESGTLVFFLSDRVPHEVTETKRERLSFAGWYKSRE